MGNNGEHRGVSGDEHRPVRIVTIAGCKGGVGKSMLACALALELGKAGSDVILVDADLGGPNLHTYLGIQSPKHVLSDFLSRRVRDLQDIAIETDYPGVRFISSAGNVPGQANPKFAQKSKIIKSLRSLRSDFVIVDIGAGSSYDVMDFYSIIEDGVLVTVPEPTSIVNSYGFVKNVLYRKLTAEFKHYSLVMELLKRGMNPDGEAGINGIRELMAEIETISPECHERGELLLRAFRPNIIVNMATSREDVALGNKLTAIIGKYLSIDATFLGHVEDEPIIKASCKRMIPFTALAPECNAAVSVRSMAHALIAQEEEARSTADLAVGSA